MASFKNHSKNSLKTRNRISNRRIQAFNQMMEIHEEEERVVQYWAGQEAEKRQSSNQVVVEGMNPNLPVDQGRVETVLDGNLNSENIPHRHGIEG